MNERWETIRDVVWPLARDVILFFAGLGLLVNEAQRTGTERLGFLGLYAAMMGLPLFLRADERGKRR